MLATSATYNFWLYELCDVYIVRNLVAQVPAMSLTPNLLTGSNEAYD